MATLAVLCVVLASAPQEVTGTVRGLSGATVAGAVVSFCRGVGGTTTDAQGCFSFPARNTGAEFVWVQGAGYRERIVPAANARNIVLEPAGTLRLKLAGSDGVSVSNAAFSFVPTRPLAFRDGSRRRLRWASEQGLADTVSLQVPWLAGHLCVEVSGHDPWVSACLDWSDGRPKDLGTVRLVASGWLTLRAVDRDGVPLRDVGYSLLAPQLPPLLSSAGGCGWGTGRGWPRFDDAAVETVSVAGSLRVVAFQRLQWLPSHGGVMLPSPEAITCEYELRLAPGESRTLRLVLEPPGWLRCRVLGADGERMGTSLVVVDGPLAKIGDPRARLSAPRHCPGDWDIWPLALPPGTYRVHRLSAASCYEHSVAVAAAQTRTVEIRSGAATDVTFDVRRNRRVQLRHADGAPLPVEELGLQSHAFAREGSHPGRWLEGKAIGGELTADGHIVFHDLAPGEYSPCLRPRGGSRSPWFTITDDDPATVVKTVRRDDHGGWILEGPPVAWGRLPIVDGNRIPILASGEAWLTEERRLATWTRPLVAGGVDLCGLEPGDYRVEVVLPPIGPWVPEERLVGRAHVRSGGAQAPVVLAR